MKQGPDNLTSPSGAQGGETPHLGALKPGPWFAGILYAVLVGSAALALWVSRFPGRFPQQLEAAAPWVFLAFVILFAGYRFVLVRAGKYPVFKAFFQVGVAVLFFTLLLPNARDRYEPNVPAAQSELTSLLVHTDPRVRALAAEVARYRPDARALAPALVRTLKDEDRAVRREAHRSLVEIHGTDLGDPETPEGSEAWERQFR